MAIVEKGQGVNVGETEIPDNQVAIKISSTDAKDYITADTTDGSERITLGQQTKIIGPGGTTGDAVPTGAGAPSLYIESSTGASSNRCTIMMNADGGNGSQIDMYVENDRKMLIMATASEQVILAEDSLVLKGESGDKTRVTVGASELGIQDLDANVITNNASDATAKSLIFTRSRSGTDGTAVVVQDDDILGNIEFKGAEDGDSWATGAKIYARVNGTPGDGDMPTELVFETTPDGTETPVARLSLSHNGIVATTTDTASCMTFGRTSSSDKLEIRSSAGTELNILGTESLRFTQSYKQVAELDGQTLEVKSENYAASGTSGGLWTDLSDTTANSSGTGNRDIAATDHDLVVGQAVALPSGNSNIYEVFTVATVTDADNFVVDSDLTNAVVNGLANTDGYKLKVLTGDGETLFAVKGNGGIEAGLDFTNNKNLGIGGSAIFDDLLDAKENVFIGHDTGNKVTTGDSNTCVGFKAGEEITSANDCVYVGREAGNSNTGYSNTGIGSSSLSVAGGVQNVAVGHGAMDACTGTQSVAVGVAALDAAGDSDNSVAVGYASLSSATGNGNVGVGSASLFSCAGGSNNTAIGLNTGGSLTGGQKCILVGKGANVSGADVTDEIAIGCDLTGGGSNTARIGQSAVHMEIDITDAGTPSWAATSDVRIKDNITDTDLGLDFINAIRAVKHTVKNTQEWPEELKPDVDKERQVTRNVTVIDEDGNESTEEQTVTIPPRPRHADNPTINDGVIAQEVKAVCDAQGVTFSGWSEDTNGLQHVQYERFVMPLIKAVQELTARIATLEAGD